MKKSDQSGFAAIEAVLVCVIIAIIGFTGYFVWNAKQSTDDSLNNTANSQPGIAKKDVKSEQQFLVFKNFGIKAPLSAELVKDITSIATAGTKTHPSGPGGTRAGYPGQIELISNKISLLCGTEQDLETLFLINRDDSDTPVATAAISTFTVNSHTYSVIPMATPDNNGCKNDADKQVFKNTYDEVLIGLKNSVAE